MLGRVLQLVPPPRQTPRLTSLFHGTPIAWKGRRTGSKAHLRPVRFSKKKKRRMLRLKREAMNKKEPKWLIRAREAEKAKEAGLNIDEDAPLSEDFRVLLEGSPTEIADHFQLLTPAEKTKLLAAGGDDKLLASTFLQEEEEEDDLAPALAADESSEVQLIAKLEALSRLPSAALRRRNTTTELLPRDPERRYDEARTLFRSLRRTNLALLQNEPRVWLAMTRCAAHAAAKNDGACDDAFALADAAFDALPEKFTKNVDGCAGDLTIDLCLASVNAKRAALCWSTFDAARNLEYFDPAPPTEMYEILMRWCQLTKLPEKALGLVGEMQAFGVRRTAKVYDGLLASAAEAPQYHRAYARLTDEILDEMQGDLLDPTPATYIALINACGRVGDSRAATLYFDEMKRVHGMRRGPAVYTAYFAALSRANLVGYKRNGIRERYRVFPPYHLLGISKKDAEAKATSLDPLTMSDYFEAKDALTFSGPGQKVLPKNTTAGRVASNFPIPFYDDPHNHLNERNQKKMRASDYDDYDDDDDDEEDDLLPVPPELRLTEARQNFLDMFEADGPDDVVPNDDREILDETDDEEELSPALQDLLFEKDDEDEDEEEEESTALSSDASLTVEERELRRHYDALGIPTKTPESVLGPVTRLRELGNNPEIDRTTEGLRARHEAHMAMAKAAFRTMEARPKAETLNAYFSVFTTALRRRQARDVAAEFMTMSPSFPDPRSHRHVVEMLVRRSDANAAFRALDACAPDDMEAIGVVLDLVSRKGDLETATHLATRLVDAHHRRATNGVGAGDQRPYLPTLLLDGDFGEFENRQPRGPPERLLRNYRRLCRINNVPQLESLPIDPVLWRQEGSRLRRHQSRKQNIVKHRAMLRTAVY